MSQVLGLNPFRRRHYRTLSLLCDEEPLSDVQLKSYQTRLQEYHNFLDSVSRLALCGNVCITEEAVTIGEHGLLTGESLNALQHAGAISVYNTLQQNNWEFPVSEEGEVAVVKTHIPIPDEFLDSEKPIRSDWPAVHISECFVEGERAKLHGSVRPLRTFLPPTIVFRNAADVDEDILEPELNVPSTAGADGNVELVSSSKGITVKRAKKDGKEVEYIPIEEYYFGREDGNKDYYEEKGDFRFKCAVCQRIFYSNVKLMSHILGHVDEASQMGLNVADATQCQFCEASFLTAFELRAHVNQEHSDVYVNHSTSASNSELSQFVAQSASQLLMQQRLGDVSDSTTDNNLLSTAHNNSEGAATGSPNRSSTKSLWACRICGKEANSELALAHHLQSTHRQREMPYVCRLCLFRSSLFEDILEHFKKEHDNSNHLLCTYCLRIFTPSDARASAYPTIISANGAVSTSGLGAGVGQTQVYLQHLRMHQIRHQLRRCPTCRLNFTNKSDYQVHRRLDHKATRGTLADKPEDLQGESFEGVVTYEEATDQAVQYVKDTHPHITLMNAPEAGRVKSLTLVRMPENVDQIACLECGDSLGSVDHKKYLPCSMCRFGTCCSAGYNRHLSRVHVYISGTHPTEPDVGMPMVRPVYFQWIVDEVAAVMEVEAPRERAEIHAQIEHTEQPVVETNEVAPLTDKLDSTDEQAARDSYSDPSLVQPLGTSPRRADESEEHLVSNVGESKQPAQYELAPMETCEPEPPVPTESVSEPVVNASVGNVDAAADADIADLFASNEEVGTNNSLAPDCTQETVHAVAMPCGIHSPETSAEDTDQKELEAEPTPELSNELSQLDIVLKYMSFQCDARRFACMQCAISHLSGNGLARHLVEECGSSTVTLNPNPALVQARLEAEEQYRLQQEQQLQEPSETAILFEAIDTNTPGTELTTGVQKQMMLDSGQVATDGDVIMVNMEPDQLASYGLMETNEDHTTMMANNQLVTQMGPTGTTIDVTNAGGEIVQQFIIPDDLQLEEGQTLVVIHDENGQPQLAIMNQSDLIDPNNTQLVMQPEEDDTNNLLLYTNVSSHYGQFCVHVCPISGFLQCLRMIIQSWFMSGQ
ncbi:hypothetical protein PHET_09846 [Paragonimus heterotremus]|uniref:C2H2-type domain-containing protein n=1 Tax=Paragonimus heterotremus TaxID=100268 RepID=A0A8J4SS31_9TREM|nr:hypothetical protein PHET_09846 [Paragonimus heterotremus]